MKAKNKCRNCSSRLQPGQVFCDECGMLSGTMENTAGEIECEQHPGRHASGLCAVCSKPLCSECTVMSTGKVICQNPDHERILQEWQLMHQLESEFEADAFVRNLADGGMEAKAFSLYDHSTARWFQENRVRLFIKKSDYEKAHALLKELKLLHQP